MTAQLTSEHLLGQRQIGIVFAKKLLKQSAMHGLIILASYLSATPCSHPLSLTLAIAGHDQHPYMLCSLPRSAALADRQSGDDAGAFSCRGGSAIQCPQSRECWKGLCARSGRRAERLCACKAAAELMLGCMPRARSDPNTHLILSLHTC